MSKVLKTAAIVVGAVALVATGVGAFAAAAAGTTLAAGAATVTAAIGVSASTLGLVAGGLSLAASLTAKKPELASAGTQTEFQPDPDAPIPYAIGRTFVAGNIAHQASSGASNELMHLVLTWSFAGPIDSFEAFQVDGQTVTFGSGGAATGGYSGVMWLKTQLGAAPEAAALSPGSGSMPGWGSSSKLSGYAAGLWTLKYDKKGKVYAAGVPRAGMIAKWVKVYDPRKDSTYPGGSGAHRPLQEATYEWQDNPWTHALTWALGRLQNGQFVLGARQKFDSIDVAAFAEAANVADANGWKIGGRVTSADDPWAVLKAMCQAGGGEPIRVGAMLSCIVNTPRVSLGTITAADLAGPCTVTATQGRRERINGIIPKYRSEDHQWEMVDAAPVRIADYVTFDGRRRTRPITYTLVQCFAGAQPVQAAQLAAYDIYLAREIPNIVTPLKIRFVGVKPGDAWTLNIPDANLHGQLCVLKTRSLDVARGVPTLTWRSETAGKHAAALGKSSTPPPTPSLGLVDLSNVPPPGSGAWVAAGTTLTANGVSVPAIVITGGVDNPAAQAVVIEYRPSGSSTWIAASTEDANLAKFELTRVTSGTDYEIGISYIVRGVTGGRRVLPPVTTGVWEGIEGADAKAISLQTTSYQAPYDKTNDYVGGLITYNTTRQNAPGSASVFTIRDAAGEVLYGPAYSDGFAAVPGGMFTATGYDNLTITAAGVESIMNAHGGTSGRLIIEAYLDNATSIVAKVSLAKTRDGADGVSALSGYLTNETHQVTADQDGNVTSYAGNGGFFIVSIGTAPITSECTFSVVSNPQDLTYGAAPPLLAGGEYAADGGLDAGEDGATITYRATHPIHGSIDRVFSVSKSKAGQDGTAPALISLATTSYQARYDQTDDYIGGAITLTAKRQNTTNAAVFTIRDPSGTVIYGPAGTGGYLAVPGGLFSSANSDTLTISAGAVETIINSHGGGEGRFTAEAHVDGLSTIVDRVSITKVKDGEDGLPGEDGFTISPASQGFTIATTSAKVPLSDEFPKQVTFKVLQGTTDVSDDPGTTYATSNTAVNASMGGTNSKVYTATGLTADTGCRSVVTIQRAGVTIAQPEITFTKAPAGLATIEGIDDTLNAMPNSTSNGLLGSFSVAIPPGRVLVMAGSAAWFAATGTYPGLIQLSHTVDGSEIFSSSVAGDITATSTEQATASISGFTYTNDSGATKTVQVRFYGRRASGSGASSLTNGNVSGSA